MTTTDLTIVAKPVKWSYNGQSRGHCNNPGRVKELVTVIQLNSRGRIDLRDHLIEFDNYFIESRELGN